MTIQTFMSGPIGTNGYLFADEARGEGMIVDAPHGAAPGMDGAARRLGVRIVLIVNTHGHWDHVADNAALATLTGAPLAVHPADAGLLRAPAAYGGALPFAIPPSVPARLLAEGEQLTIGGAVFTVMHTPGHSPGGVCLYDPVQGVLFSGDTLFDGAYGRTDLPGASEATMWRSLARLAELPRATAVYPGHGDASTIEAQTWLTSLTSA